MKKFKGFTMTELMVALAVIGIIVAVVTPAIMRTRPNKNKMMIKKAYYTTENIVSSLINDASLYTDRSYVCVNPAAADPAAGIYCAYGFDDDEEAVYEGEKYSGNNKFQKLFAAKLNVANADDTSYTKFTTTDGIYWDFDSDKATNSIHDGWAKSTGTVVAPSDNIRTLVIDVNGKDKGPNKLESECSADEKNDFDIFRMDIQSNGKMRVNPSVSRAAEFVTINPSVRN